jgi:deoxycytidylate deaminase
MNSSVKILNLLSLMAEDIDVSQTSNRARLAAAIVYRNRIISIGTNQKKSHPFQKKYAPNEDAIYLHAEVSAIKNALRHIDEKVLAKSTLYICRIKRTGARNSPFTWGISKPCTGCQRAIATFNIKTVVYSEEGVGTYDSL